MQEYSCLLILEGLQAIVGQYLQRLQVLRAGEALPLLGTLAHRAHSLRKDDQSWHQRQAGPSHLPHSILGSHQLSCGTRQLVSTAQDRSPTPVLPKNNLSI